MGPARQDAYWKATRRITVALLAAWLAVSFGAGLGFADALDAVRVGGVPLGFWFGQQGAVVAFVLLAFAWVRLANRLDRRFGAYED